MSISKVDSTQQNDKDYDEKWQYCSAVQLQFSGRLKSSQFSRFNESKFEKVLDERFQSVYQASRDDRCIILFAHSTSVIEKNPVPFTELMDKALNRS